MDNPGHVGDIRTDSEESNAVGLLYVGGSDGSETVTAAVSAATTPFELYTCSRVSEALELIATEPIDCVVTEQTLPERTGLALLGEIRERADDLPVILFADDGDESVASEAISLGVTDYIAKTPSEEQTDLLLRRVAAVVTERDERQAILDRMTDAFFALDRNWEFTYLNDRGREIVREAASEHVSTDELVGRNIWEVLPEAIGTEFYEQYHDAMDEQSPVVFEAKYETLDTWFEVRGYPSSTGLSVYFRDITDRVAREQSITRRERALREMYRVTAQKETPLETKVESLLAIGKDLLGTEFGALSRIEGETYVFEITDTPENGPKPGDTVPLSTTNCERAIVEEETLVLSDIAEQAPELTDRAGFIDQGVRCYLGTPVVVDGSVTGTFCFYDQAARTEPFSEWEVTLVELMGNWVSYERERQRREQALTRERNRMADFASFVSHDLRNPLNVAVGRLDLIEDEYDGDPEHVSTVESALERMDDLIEDALTLARATESSRRRRSTPVRSPARPGPGSVTSRRRWTSSTRLRWKATRTASDSCSRTSFGTPWNTPETERRE
ncbi:response regulator [Haloarcula halophila]|uniref:response regulator n=1 Tax=Haloarcula TaxID=2237 RepID=UPI0023E352F3|nr:response regulator [Halomicroarcula sp. DFY41]